MVSPSPVQLSAEVADALARGAAVVALESTIISHGLPRPRNLEVATELEAIVRKEGAVPATIAVLDGVPRVGLTPQELERVAHEPGLRKFGRRDLALAAGLRASGATTVSATAFLAARAGIRVFATGGLGGVHIGYGEHQDESADLDTLSRIRITVVCAGVKSFLDVAATLERLETRGVAVVGYRTDEFPGFFLHGSGLPVEWRIDSPAEAAAIMWAQEDLGGPESALIVANPVPVDRQLDPRLYEEAYREAHRRIDSQKITGKEITPFLLDTINRLTKGASLEANLAAVRGNVALAAQIAICHAKRR